MLNGESFQPRLLEDRAKQERPPAHRNTPRLRQTLDAHDGRIGIGAAEFVPEIERGHWPREESGGNCRRNRWRALRTISSSTCRLDRAAADLNEKMAVVMASPPSSSGARSSK